MKPFAQFREYHGDEMIPLRMHVAKRAADEDADFVVGSGHIGSPYSYQTSEDR